MTSPANKFGSGTRAGISLSVVASMLSAISVSIVLGYIVIKRVKKFRERRAVTKPHANTDFIPLDAIDSLGFLNLMVSGLIQALSGLLSIRWVARDFVAEGALCTAQGRIKQIGDVGVALFSLVIAFDTFFMFCFGWRAQKRIRSWAIIGIGLFIIMLVAVGSGVHSGSNTPYYGNTRFWCWIRPEYKTERIALQYLWMWAALFVILILYGFMALVKYGYVVVKSTGSQTDKRTAKTMLFYPAVYVFCVLPLSIVRWVDLNDDNLPAAAIIVTSIIYSLSGLFNVLLYKFTRPALILGDVDSIDSPSRYELPASVSGYSGLPTGAEGTAYKPTGFGMFPNEGIPRPVVASPGLEASAAKHARTHAGSQAS